MAWSADNQLVFRPDMVEVAHVVGDDGIFIRHDAFHCRNDALSAQVDRDFLQVFLDVGGRHCQQQGVGFAAHGVDV